MNKLLTRAITGSLYVALIVFSLILESSVLFCIVFSLFIILGIWEFQSLTDNKHKNPITGKILDIIGGLILFFSIYLKVNNPEFGIELIVPYIGYIIAKNIYQLYVTSSNVLENWAYSFMGQLFVALPLSLLNIIYTEFNPHILLALFIFIWLNDTGAFCVGSLIGKHRLFERISPKKSWEGFWGGLVFCIVTAACFHTWCNSFFQGPEMLEWIALSIIVSVFATFGDLSESLIKRSVGVKDSGKLLPGHGGILDRIDSLLMVASAALAFLILL